MRKGEPRMSAAGYKLDEADRRILQVLQQDKSKLLQRNQNKKLRRQRQQLSQLKKLRNSCH